MVESDNGRKTGKVSPEVAAKNRRLAIFLGVVAFGIYATYLLTHLL